MAQSRTLERILAEAKRLPLADQRKLVHAIERDLLDTGDETQVDRRAALDRWIARAGTGHSAHTDVSTSEVRTAF